MNGILISVCVARFIMWNTVYKRKRRVTQSTRSISDHLKEWWSHFLSPPTNLTKCFDIPSDCADVLSTSVSLPQMICILHSSLCKMNKLSGTLTDWHQRNQHWKFTECFFNSAYHLTVIQQVVFFLFFHPLLPYSIGNHNKIAACNYNRPACQRYGADFKA